MVIEFGRASDVAECFLALLAGALVLIGVVIVVTFVNDRRNPAALRMRSLVLLGLLGFFCSIPLAYWFSYAEFIRAEVTATGIRLTYAGPFGGVQAVPRAAIDTILFGTPGKGRVSPCYLRVLQKSGASHRSRALPLDIGACKALRNETLAALSPTG